MLIIQIQGLNTLANALQQCTDTMCRNIQTALARTASDIAQAAKNNTHGTLADSIHAQISSDGFCATVTADSPYAVFIEYGVNIPAIKPHNAKALHFVKNGQNVFVKSAQAHTVAPQPFMAPAAEAYADAYAEHIQQAITL